MRVSAPPERWGRWRRSDRDWCLLANRAGTRHWIRGYFVLVSRLGDGVFWYVLMAALVVFDGWRGLLVSVHLALTGILALSLYRWLKRWTRRPRPFVSDPRIRAWIAPLDEFSFPSGHTLHAVSFTIVACAHYPLLAWGLVPFAASVGVSRMVLGLHYPSDVLAATSIGAALAAMSVGLGPQWPSLLA